MSERLSFGERLRHGWNAFINPIENFRYDYGRASYISPTRVRLTAGNEQSIIAPVYNRIALDVAALDFKHVKLNDLDERFDMVVDDGLNECLSLVSNKDQISDSFIQDIVLSMFDEGVVAIVPTDTDINPKQSEGFDIKSMRVGKIIQWYPDHVKVRLYNDRKGEKEEITLPKSSVAIATNPFYIVMNEPNSVAKRLVRKLNILDVIDEQAGSGKLDMVIQLPGVVKTEARRKQAKDRLESIQDQLTNSKYGIAYVDSTEKITQLNRAVENNLMNQVTFLTSMLYSQLGMDESILKGTADPQTMANYYTNTVTPVASAIVKSMKCKFISKTARTRHHSIMYFRDPFKGMPVDKIAETFDKFTRNEVASSNEMRSVLGWRPSSDPRADELRNKNLNAQEGYEPIYTENNEEGGSGSGAGGIPDVGKMKLSELRNMLGK